MLCNDFLTDAKEQLNQRDCHGNSNQNSPDDDDHHQMIEVTEPQPTRHDQQSFLGNRGGDPAPVVSAVRGRDQWIRQGRGQLCAVQAIFQAVN